MTGPAPSPVRGIVDLSHPLDDGTPVYPGDPVARFTPATTIGEHGYNVLHVRMGSQTGTHVDAPYHFLEERVVEVGIGAPVRVPSGVQHEHPAGGEAVGDRREIGPGDRLVWRLPAHVGHDRGAEEEVQG